ncbi:MAG: hypothetical protein IJ232_11655 [Lachnospiraceae bacterium]|nr:hypothetical protein [Lachnospiraceae bacterium]
MWSFHSLQDFIIHLMIRTGIRDPAGTQLTEDVVEAFLRLVEQEKLRAPDDDGGGNMTEIDNVK